MTTESDLKKQMTRYLLGELSDAEQVALEQQYFTDPRVFTHLAEIETDLADDYARNQLTTAQRLNFERRYLANPHLRERAAMAQSLRDHFQPPSRIAVTEPPPVRWSWLAWLTRPVVVGGLVTASVVLTAMSFLWWRETQRLHYELAAVRASQQQGETQRRALESQLTDERERNAQLQNDLSQAQPAASARSIVTLLLTATGLRAPRSESTPRLMIPADVAQVRFQLTIPATDEYRSYRVAVQSVGGTTLWQRQNFKPRIQQKTASFTFELPASLFKTGEYVLNLTGVTAQGDVDEVSQSLFRIVKR